MKNNKQNWKIRFQEAFTPYSSDNVIHKAIEEKNRKIPKKLFRFRCYNQDHPEYFEEELSGNL
jgi:hypothetical protein